MNERGCSMGEEVNALCGIVLFVLIAYGTVQVAEYKNQKHDRLKSKCYKVVDNRFEYDRCIFMNKELLK